MTARVVPFNLSGLEEAAGLVKGGALVVYPTDTVYGLGANPRDGDAVGRLFRAKSREAKPIPLLCDGFSSAVELAELNAESAKIARRHWPGALTIVAPLRAELPFQIHQGTGTVGVRVPDSDLCIEFIRLCGGSVTGTSANISGMQPSRSAEEAAKQLGDAVDLVMDGGRLRGDPSTVVRVAGEGVEVLREGPVRVNDEVVM